MLQSQIATEHANQLSGDIDAVDATILKQGASHIILDAVWFCAA